MNILLVQAYLGGTEQPVFPIGLACVASSLRDHNVKIYDPNVSEDPFGELADILAGFRPEVIGISIRNIDSTNKREVVFYYPHLKKMIDAVKAGTCNGSVIVAGGSGFSMFAREIMEDEQRIDFGILLEGEVAFRALLENLSTPEKVKSVFFRRNGDIVFTGPGPQIDINNTDLAYKGVASLAPYSKMRDAVGVETKRGCGFNCIYCIYGFLNGRALRLREPAMVVDEIELLVKEHGVEQFTFLDSVFNAPLGHARDICREIIRRNIKVNWSAWFNEKGLTREFVELVINAGCKNIILSPDGFSDDILKRLGKNITKADILESYAILKEPEGTEVSYNFFKNPPGQTLAAFVSLMLFCIKARKEMGRRVHFELNSIRIEPHTALFKLAYEEGVIREDQNLLYPIYYVNTKTAYIDFILNPILRLLGK